MTPPAWQDILPDIVKWRRDLHQIPELGLELPQTVNYVSKVLDELDIPYSYLVSGNGIVAEIKGYQEGKVFAFRADMDGLPIVEETGLDFASKNGNMHACGHDAHTALLLGIAKYLNSIRTEWRGRIKLLFQPGEEFGNGAKLMVEEGALRNPDVDVIFGLHQGNLSLSEEHGTIVFKKGTILASSDSFDLFVEGKGTHAAYPNKGIDPIPIAAQLITEIQRIKSREIGAEEFAVISVSGIQGGSSYNICPESVHLMGTVRACDEALRAYILKRLEELCEGLSLATRAKVRINIWDSCPPTVNDAAFTEFAYQQAKKVCGDAVRRLEKPVMGAEDMGFFLREVPGTYALLINPRPVDGVLYPHHHPKFDIDEARFEMAARMMSSVALAYLNR